MYVCARSAKVRTEIWKCTASENDLRDRARNICQGGNGKTITNIERKTVRDSQERLIRELRRTYS